MPRLTFFKSVLTSAATGAGYGCLAAATLVGISSATTLYLLNNSQDACLQYIVILAMNDAHTLSIALPGAGLVLGAVTGALEYCTQPEEQIERTHTL